MIGMSAIGAIVKGFFDSLWSAIRTNRIDREKTRVAEIEAENARLKGKEKLQTEIKKENEKIHESKNIDDVLDRFD